MLVMAITLVQASIASKDQKIVPDSAFLIDAIEAVVFGQGGTQVITRSDVSRPNLSGVPQSLDDIIFERLVFLDAQKYKILPDDDAVDKYLAMVQKENNMTLDQLKDVFASAGYTYEEGRQQFRMMQTVSSMIDFKIRSQVIVPKKQVEEYYEQNPVVTEAKIKVQIGFIPIDYNRKDAQKKAVDYMTRTRKEMKGIEWGEPFELKQSEVADDKAFLFSLDPGSLSPAIEVPGGYQVYKILESEPERVQTLEERYHEIADILRRPIFEELMDAYKKNLFSSVAIVRFG